MTAALIFAAEFAVAYGAEAIAKAVSCDNALMELDLTSMAAADPARNKHARF
jgi:mevalonate kinase